MVTARQRQVLGFIRVFVRRQGISPTVREVQAHFRFASPNAAYAHLTALRRKGFLIKRERTARNSQPVDLEEGMPVFGTIPAGLPVEADSDTIERIPISEALFGVKPGDPVFGLLVQGDSMNGAGIVDGDLVILTVRRPTHRAIVAALVDGQSTLKRYLDEKGGPVLRAENPAYRDIRPASELLIQGVMVGLVRRGSH